MDRLVGFIGVEHRQLDPRGDQPGGWIETALVDQPRADVSPCPLDTREPRVSALTQA